MLNIVELLELRGLDTGKDVKLVRHQDKDCDVNELYQRGQINIYQSYQSKTVFDECDYIVSFIGFEGTKARLLGVYKVNGRIPAVEFPPPMDFLYPDMFGSLNDYNYYELEEAPGFNDLNDRVVIDWGKSTRSWHQWLCEKEVIEILPKGYVKAFPGYLDFVISFDELKRIIGHPNANKVWHTMLSAVAGIYLIVDRKTGKQYVGSAYGKSGILGRWTEYAKNGHADNAKLRELLENQTHERNLHFTILRTLSKTSTSKEVIECEQLYKTKLGTQDFGLNLN